MDTPGDWQGIAIMWLAVKMMNVVMNLMEANCLCKYIFLFHVLN